MDPQLRGVEDPNRDWCYHPREGERYLRAGARRSVASGGQDPDLAVALQRLVMPLSEAALSHIQAHPWRSGVSQAASVEDGRAVLRTVTNGYARRDIYNMDETAYFYCAAPSKMIATKRFSGHKSSKKRMTVAVARNADGSFKLPLLFVGGSCRPRCFGGKSLIELGVEYVSSAKGWMNSELFQGWAERFNGKMRAEKRRVLLLLDSVSSHA